MTPTPEQVERSRKRNRERYGEEGVREMLRGALRSSTDADRALRAREAKAGPRFGPKYNSSGVQVSVVDRWGGPEPPSAA